MAIYIISKRNNLGSQSSSKKLHRSSPRSECYRSYMHDIESEIL